MEKRTLAEMVGATFPALDFAMAYGSGVVRQDGYEPEATSPRATGSPAPPPAAAPMVDMVFAVRDPVAWHAANLKTNYGHYSFVGSLGARSVAFLQDAVGARVYYNTLVPIPRPWGAAPGTLMK
jgi:translocator assembly and maintenance protein 41